MNSTIDPDKIRIPAFLRKKAIVRQAKQQLILTALDRKLAGLGVHSSKPLAPFVRKKGSIVNRKNNSIKNEAKNTTNGFQKTKSISAEYDHFLIVPIGTVIDYYEKIQVAVIRLKETLRIGDIIQIASKNMLFQQPVESMQINRKPVKMAKKSAEIGLKVFLRPQINSAVYKVVPAEIKKAANRRDNLVVVGAEQVVGTEHCSVPTTCSAPTTVAHKTFSQPLF